MSLPVLICDDSALARKQMARSLPPALNAEITFAVHGLDALEQLEQNEFKIMFLDLTMPELDGFGTLDEIQARGIDIKVVVVSGDIQPKAKERVMASGAKAFIQKPIDKDILNGVLKELVEPPLSRKWSLLRHLICLSLNIVILPRGSKRCDWCGGGCACTAF